jgi:uncharacterized tellurite resistance protein B-like protein
MTAEAIRSQNDRKLFEVLRDDPDVAAAQEELDNLRQSGYVSMRRRLLATSVRLSRGMAKSVHATAEACGERLGLKLPLELYVYASPQFNAACISPEEGRLFVMFSSSLLESFGDRELCFVMGHEIGHYIYGHHDIPIGFILSGERPVAPRLALDLFAWSRYAEISADRAGAYCANDMHAVGLALFRLASGLSTSTIDFDLDEFLAQIDDMQAADAELGQGSPREDWFATHPFSPLRVKALQAFHDSSLMRLGGTSVDALEIAVQGMMTLMEASYMEGRSPVAETMRRLLFAGAVAVANADGRISEAEIVVFEKFFGSGAFRSDLDIEKITADLPSRISQATLKTSIAHRMQVLRDLCLIARAEDEIGERERSLLKKIAKDLDIKGRFVEQCLAGALDPD